MAPRDPLNASAPLQLLTGQPAPLGAHAAAGGCNFALFSANATAVELCLFNADGTEELTRLTLPTCTNGVWHGWLAQAADGLVYGYRVHGPWAPAEGHRFDARKLLLDPYARALVGTFSWQPQHFSHDPGRTIGAGAGNNAPWMPKAQVVADTWDWGDDAPPAIPLSCSVLYEVHVRGFTQLHPQVPAAQRGTYAGLASAPAIAHLQSLGVTAVNLLPVHYAIDEQRLAQMGLRNYWGYNTLAYFAPDPRLAGGLPNLSARDEFRHMVRSLHAAGIEVILDVVFNHTAESDELGPTLSFRGIDNASYYRLRSDQPALYENHTGCGNTLKLAHPRVLQLVMDALRYWVTDMHVDGFRFDLAATLAREDHGFDAGSGFLDAIGQDPVLSRVKLFAEPWDIGPGGYQLGQFPPGWTEWNDRFRDSLRGFWLQRNLPRGELAHRLCASSDLFRARGRAPQASLNFITAHDGFTLRDLVSHDHKHNQANGEDNRDGHHDNRSWNCGVEGTSSDPAVLHRRARLQRALLASLLLAQGVPMLLGGDELGRTQQGNNNAYCQDNAINWFDWSNPDLALMGFVGQLIRLRQRFPALHSTRWFDGVADAAGERDLTWLEPDGQPVGGDAWWNGWRPALAFRLAGTEGGPALLVLFNAGEQAQDFTLPPGRWSVRLDTQIDAGAPLAPCGIAGIASVAPHCVLVLAAGL